MAQYDINLREYWRILKKRRILVILTAIVLGIFSTFFAILRAPTPLYHSVCKIKVEKQLPVEGLYGKSITAEVVDLETQISVIKSYGVFQAVAEKLGFIPPGDIKEGNPLKYNVISTIESLQSKVEVERMEFTKILNIKVTDTSPAFAQRLANTIALAYKEFYAEHQMKRTTEALKYIDEQLKRMRQKLRESEDEFNRFSQENNMISVEMQGDKLMLKTQEIQEEINRLHKYKRELQGILQRLNQFIENPTGSNPKFNSKHADSEYQSTNKALVELLLKKDTLLKTYTPRHPQVVAISNEIIENARKMLIFLHLQLSEMETQEIDLKEELEKVDRKTHVLMDKKLEYNRLKRKVKLHDDMTALLEQKNQEALIRKAEKPEEVTIVKPALLPTNPVNPPKTAATGAMGIVIGMVLGLVIAFIMETFDTSLGAIEDVEETLGTQVLGVIPQADERDVQEVLKGKYPEGMQEASGKQRAYLRSHFTPKSMVAESFRALRTNIQFQDTKKEIKTIAITSTSPQEGKTIVAINLAITMAQAGMKILLVGSDLRKPMLAKVFGIEATPGLTDILLGNYPWRDTVKGVTDMILGKMTLDEVMMTPGMDNLHIITSGPVPSNPAELIDSRRLTDFMEEAKEEYDLILFDSPPVLSAADAAILGTKVDGVLLVYRLGTVSRGLLKRSTSQLEQINCHIIGVILNGMRPEVSPDFHDYKYYRYYYSYEEEDKGRRGSGHKKRFSFSRKKEDNSLSPDGDVLPPGVGKDAQENQGKKLNLLRLSLMVLAFAFLVLGMLWHNGIMDPLKLLNVQVSTIADGMKSSVKKRLSGNNISRKPKAVPTKPESTISGKNPESAAEMPIPPSSLMAKGWAEVDTPASSLALMSFSVERPTTSPLAAGKNWAEVDTPTSPLALMSFSMEGPAHETETHTPSSLAVGKGRAEVDTHASSQKTLSYPYSIQLGAYRTLQGAENAVFMYRIRGLSPYRVKVDFKEKGVWYRVFVGHFENSEQAERFKQEHALKKSQIKRTRYANLIGTHSNGDELANQIRLLKSHGYSPYVIKGQDGKSRLFVGAFLTKGGAEAQWRDLNTHEIQSELVHR